MRLNKFLAQSGVASRRKADELIQMATTEVNGKICQDPAYNVKDSDVVKYDGQQISPILEKVVIMLHKPKKVITTVKDTHGRKTVLDLVPSKYRLTPIEPKARKFLEEEMEKFFFGGGSEKPKEFVEPEK